MEREAMYVCVLAKADTLNAGCDLLDVDTMVIVGNNGVRLLK